MRTNLLSKCTKEIENLSSQVTAAISGSAEAITKATDQDNEFKLVVESRLSLAKAWSGTSEKALTSEEFREAVKSSDAAAVDEDNLTNLSIKVDMQNWVSEIKNCTTEIEVKAKAAEWSAMMGSVAQLVESLSRSRKDLNSSIATRIRQEKKKVEREQKDAEKKRKREEENTAKEAAAHAGSAAATHMGASIGAIEFKVFSCDLADVHEVTGVTKEVLDGVDWEAPWTFHAGSSYDHLLKGSLGATVNMFCKLYQTSSNKNYQKVGYGTSVLEKAQGLSDVDSILFGCMPPQLDVTSAGFTGMGDVQKLLLTQGKVHLYGLNPKKNFMCTRFASESMHANTLRLHLVGDLEVLLMPPTALDKHFKNGEGCLKSASVLNLFQTGKLSDAQRCALLRVSVKPMSMLYVPAGWLTVCRGSGDSQHQCGVQLCFYHSF